MGVADVRAHMMQVVKELAKEVVFLGFRKGKAPLKRVKVKEGVRVPKSRFQSGTEVPPCILAWLGEAVAALGHRACTGRLAPRPDMPYRRVSKAREPAYARSAAYP